MSSAYEKLKEIEKLRKKNQTTATATEEKNNEKKTTVEVASNPYGKLKEIENIRNQKAIDERENKISEWYRLTEEYKQAETQYSDAYWLKKYSNAEDQFRKGIWETMREVPFENQVTGGNLAQNRSVGTSMRNVYVEAVQKEHEDFKEKQRQLRAKINELTPYKEVYEGERALEAADFAEYAAKGAEIEDNPVEYARKNVPNSGLNFGGKYNSRYHHMTKTEVDIYNYLLGKHGKERAERYLDGVEQFLNAREAQRRADAITGIDVPVVEDLAIMGYGLTGGAVNAISHLDDMFRDEAQDPTVFEMYSQYADEKLGEEGGLKLAGKTVGQWANAGAQTVGAMVPSIVAAYVATKAGAPQWAAEIIGAGVTALQTGGTKHSQNLREGYEVGESRANAIATGVAEGGLQYALTGISNLGGVNKGRLMANAKAIKNPVLRGIAVGGLKTGGEIAEEELQLVIEPWLDAAILGKEYEAPSLEEIRDTAIISALTVCALEGGGIAKDARSKSPIGELIIKRGGETAVADTISLGLKRPNNSELFKLAKKLDEKVKKGETVSTHELGLLAEMIRVENKNSSTKNGGGNLMQYTRAEADGKTVTEEIVPALPGFVKSEYSSKIGNKTLRALDAIGKKLGVEISIGAPTGNSLSAENGHYENGRIVIAQDAKNPLEVVLCHEVTHHMKMTAPAEYNAFVEMAIEASEKLSGAEKTELINRYRQAYSEGTGEAFSDTQAIDEITADYASRLVNDISLFNELANSDRNVAQRFIDSVKEFLSKVRETFSGDKSKADTASMEKYGTTVEGLEAAVAQFEKMLSATETAVANGNINTAGTDAGGGEASVFVKLKNSIPLLEGMPSVKKLTGKEFAKSEKNLIEQVTEFFNSIGSKVKRIGFGEVLLNKQGAKDDLGHGIGRAKAVTFAAVPEVIKNGKQIDYQENWKGRGEDSYIFAAPVEIKGKRGYVAAVVLRDATNRFYLHEVVDGEGNVFQIKNEGTSKSFKTASFDEIELIRDKDVPSDTIIPDSPEKSNRQNSLKTEDLLSPDYGKTEDTSSVSRSSTPSPQGEGSGESSHRLATVPLPLGKEGSDGSDSHIESPGLDEYFDDLTERAKVTSDKRIREANAALMKGPATSKKPFGEKVGESVSFIKRKMVNSADAIRKIAKTVKDEHLYGVYNRARSSMNIVSDMLKNKQTNIRGQKVGESLEGIIAPIKEKGEEYWNNLQLYLLHKHNVSRMSLKDTKAEELARTELEFFIRENPDVAAMGETELQRRSEWEDDRGLKARKYLELRDNLNRAQNTNNKPIFFDSDEVPLNAEESRAVAAELLRKNPEFAQDEAKIRTYLDNLMEYRVESGLITQEEADYFKKKYPDYVPTYRDTETVRKQLSGELNIGTTVGKAKGGNEKILPLDVALSEMTKKVVRSGQKNIFANKLFELYNNNSKAFDGYITDVKEGNRDVDSEIDGFGEEKTLDNTVRFHENGKSVELTVTPELFEAFDALSKVPKEQPAVAKVWRKVNDVYKKLITTYDPTFIVRNGLKDLQDAVFNSTDLKGFAKNYLRAYKEIATGGEMWELYQAAGGLYSSRFEELQNEGVTSKGGKLNLKEKLAFGNMIVEQAPRLAEFMTVYEKGDPNNSDTLSDALLAAADVTTNFGESGTWGKVLNSYYIPFLNPAIQGTAKVVRTFTGTKTAKQWMGLAVKTTLYGLGAAFLNDLINGDDEDYENLPDRTKDNYFLFPVGDGKFLKLPKGRVTAALGVVTDRVRDTMKGEKVDTGEAFSRVAENILPENPLNNNIFKAWFDADLFNEESKGRTWYGTDIENESLQSLPAGERYDSSTDYISKYIGKALGVSPKKLNYILQQYTGGVGRMVLPMLTPSEQKGDSVAGNIALGTVSFLTSNFSTDSKLSNKVSGEFYDAVDEATQKKNSSKGTLADKVVYKHLNRERNQMSSYNSMIRDAEVDDNLTSKERRAAVRVATAERTDYQERILDNLPEYRESVEKHLKKYPGTEEEKKLEYAYREANREIYGAEYAIRVNGGSDVYKKAEEKVKRGKTTWEKYYDEYFGKAERRFDKIADRFGISYADFERIEEAISKNSKKADEIVAIDKLGYKRGVARRIRDMYYEAE